MYIIPYIQYVLEAVLLLRRKQQREQEKGRNYFFEFVKIQRHFFNELTSKLKRVKDPRAQGYITYGPEVLLFTVLTKSIANLQSMRSLSSNLNKDECIKNIGKILGIDGLDELPHYDTINDFLSRLSTGELEHIRTYMIKELLKKRCFENYRIEGKYWGVIFDGTGLFSFDKKHCEHCLKREHKDKEAGEVTTVYMHHVLEAKLVVGDMVLSIGSEFIENESEDVTKQDCELKAFYRLAEKIKRTYKRLPICMLADSLYACEPVFKVCDGNRWQYLMRFKEGRIRSIAAEFRAIADIEQREKGEQLYWANDIAYNERSVHLLELNLEIEEGKTQQYLWITSIKITKRNAQRLADVGRSRWKIENEGFNNQKNIRYHIEHASSHNYNAMKNHYLLTQIADILMQLYENGVGLIKELKKTAKEISSNLLEAIRTRTLTDEDISRLAKPTQVRFT